MRKFTNIVLVLTILTLSLSLSACGMRNNMTDDGMTVLPTMDATIGTNIPDPNVDTQMPMYTAATDMDSFTDPTESITTTNNPSTQK